MSVCRVVLLEIARDIRGVRVFETFDPYLFQCRGSLFLIIRLFCAYSGLAPCYSL